MLDSIGYVKMIDFGSAKKLEQSSLRTFTMVGTPYRTVPYRTVPYRTVPYHTIPYHTILHDGGHTIPYYTLIYYAILYCTVLQ